MHTPLNENWQNISGAEAQMTVPGQPEVPYTHDYSQTMTMKLFLANPRVEGGSDVSMTLDEALEKIRAVDRITLGTHKIVYLVGWQYDGHDSKYPAFRECNEALRRPGDASARDSLIWLFEEAKKYNTTVSLHINMMDAYDNSPLWDEYMKKGLICHDAYGKPVKGGCWGGRQACLVCYKREWDSGLAVRRIDELCELLPIREAGTVHIDAFMNPCIRGGCCEYNTGERFGDPSIEARRKIYRYFRSLGIDVTSEHLIVEPEVHTGKDHSIGLQPMAWQLSQRPEDYLRRPATLVCGGRADNRQRGDEGGMMGHLFGDNVRGEELFPLPDYKEQFLRQFCCVYLPFTFLNALPRLSLERYGDGQFRASFGDGVTTDTDRFTIRRGEDILKCGNTVCLPARWLKEDNRVLYTDEAGEHVWKIGDALGERICARRLGVDGLSDECEILTVENGEITRNHDENSAWVCTRA